MANIKKFNDMSGTGNAIELQACFGMKNAEFAARFPGVKGMYYDGYTKWVGYAAGRILMPVTRQITMKSNPSKHVCNAKCLGGKLNGSCECSCNGANHGRGFFTKLF